MLENHFVHEKAQKALNIQKRYQGPLDFNEDRTYALTD